MSDTSNTLSGRPRLLSAAAFVGALLAFTLPFGAIESCSGEEVRFTGVELVTYDVKPDLSESNPNLHEEVENLVSPFALVVLAAATAGLGLAFRGRRHGGLCASVGLLAAQLLGVAIAVTGTGGGGPIVGYWLAVAALTAASAVHLVDAVRRRQRDGRRFWGYAVAGTAVTLSPTLAIGVLLAIVGVAG
jgi:hypothetical protein